MLGALLGNYRIEERLGEGGMGVVYAGRHEQLGHRVAVKVLRPERSGQADMVQRFFNEAQAATAIKNPGIVQVFDVGTTPEGHAYFVMELLEGQDLGARIEQRRLGYEECCRIGRQVANILQAAHAADITHRDLKPDNLFLVPDPEVVGGERVKVLDFGIAKLAGEALASGTNTQTGLVMGTPNYMSPEQCRSIRNADARSDIYSLGCILFEMACGRPPFLGEGTLDLVGAHLSTTPPHPQNLAPDMPPALSALIAKMLSKHPEARPQTMTAVGRALDEILRTLEEAQAGAPARAPTSGPHPRARTPLPAPSSAPAATTLGGAAGASSTRERAGARPRPLVLGGLAAAGAAAVIAIVVLVAGGSDAPDERAEVPGPAEDAAGAVAVTPADAANAAAASADAADAPLVAAGADAASPAQAEPPPDAGADAAADEPEPPLTADELAAECRGYQVDRKWEELKRCADQLQPLDPEFAEKLRARAVQESRSAPRPAPPPRCNHAVLADRALKLYQSGRLTESIASFDEAIACRFDLRLVQQAFVIACNLHDKARARSYWKRMPPAARHKASQTCVRNGITEAVLDAP